MQGNTYKSTKRHSGVQRDLSALPDSAHIRAAELAEWLDVAQVTVWRWSRDGRLPKPRKLGPRVTVWNLGQIRKAIGHGEE